jgi:hypothetical protein
LKVWLREIEFSGLSDEYKVCLALECARGRLYREVIHCSQTGWKELKAMIQEAFLAHNYIALQKKALESIKQSSSEGLRAFNLKFRDLAQEAYPNPTQTEVEILVNRYLSALYSEKVVDKILDKRIPETLNEAMELALQMIKADEIKLASGRSARVDAIHGLRDGASAPAESEIKAISSLVTQSNQSVNQLTGEVQKLVQAMQANAPTPATAAEAAMNYRQTPPINASAQGNKPRFLWDSSGRPVCFHCRVIGHMKRECPVLINANTQPLTSKNAEAGSAVVTSTSAPQTN